MSLKIEQNYFFDVCFINNVLESSNHVIIYQEIAEHVLSFLLISSFKVFSFDCWCDMCVILL